MNTGLDPEILLIAQDRIHPAEYYLPGPVRVNGKLNQLSFDNAAAEFRPEQSGQPSKLVARLRALVRQAVLRLKTAMVQNKVPVTARWSLAPSGQLMEQHRALYSVSRFGCSPSSCLMDDYGTQEVVPFANASQTVYRSAGFHIHQELPATTSIETSVAVLDAILGLADVLINAKLKYLSESRVRRMTLGYGRAGEFRSRAIGGVRILEYRVLSPWPFMSPRMTESVILLTRSICAQPESVHMKALDNFPDRVLIARAINNCDPQAAAELHAACWNTWATLIGSGNAKSKRFSGLMGDVHDSDGSRNRVGLLRAWE